MDVRSFIDSNGLTALVIDDLTADDLTQIGWSGNPAHIRSVAKKLSAVAHGEIDYVAVRAPDGSAIAECAIEYSATEPHAEITQLAVRADLQGLGIATRLIREAEDRIRGRGKRWAVLGVELGDVRPRALYERLGYKLFGREKDSWEVEDEGGEVSVHEADVLLLRRDVTV